MPSPLSRTLTARLKMRHLVLLNNIQRYGSLSRLADATGISQPAATKALAEIEDIFEASLFVRAGRGLQPTRLGQLAITKARHMLQEVDAWAVEMNAVRDGRTAHLHIGATPYVPSALLTQAVMQLYERHNVAIAIKRATTDELVRSLHDREIDCVIGRPSAISGMNDLWHEVLYAQRPVLIGHEKLANRLRLLNYGWRELASMKWILPSASTPVGAKIAEMFNQSQVRPPVPVIETYSVDIIHGILSANDSIVSIVPSDIAADLIRRGGVAAIPWQMDWELPPISLIRRVRSSPLDTEEKFAGILHSLCAPATPRPYA